jgi:hypothetical protein
MKHTAFLDSLRTLGLLLWNKGLAIVLLILLMVRYATLEGSTPFAEILYAIILAATVIVGAPIVRLLVFPEAAEYAESGTLRKDLSSGMHPFAVRHYWFATAVSYTVTLLCVSKLLS